VAEDSSPPFELFTFPVLKTPPCLRGLDRKAQITRPRAYTILEFRLAILDWGETLLGKHSGNSIDRVSKSNWYYADKNDPSILIIADNDRMGQQSFFRFPNLWDCSRSISVQTKSIDTTLDESIYTALGCPIPGVEIPITSHLFILC